MAEHRATGRVRRADLTEPEYRVLARFRFALRVFLRFSEDAAREAGVTPNQHQLLLAIRGFPTGDPSVTEFAEWLQLKHHSTVELVDRAVDANLISRHPDANDRRRQRLALTARGAEALASLSDAHREELRRFRGEMSTSSVRSTEDEVRRGYSAIVSAGTEQGCLRPPDRGRLYDVPRAPWSAPLGLGQRG